MRILFMIFLTTALFATSTLTVLRTFTQSDGSTFKARLKGDARLHWIETEDGDILIFNKKSADFEYAKIEDGDLVLSGRKYKVTKNRALHVRKESIKSEDLKNLWIQRHH